jgi:3-isopropylmalate/(R)-2-methylmalate dehydratase small subunit
VVATSFARIFFRNAINIGLPVIEAADIWEQTEQGDILEADPDAGILKNVTKGKEYKTAAYPEFVREIITAGGLIEWVKAREVGR